MATEYVLIRDDNKEMFELGKQRTLFWQDMEDAFDAEVFSSILPHWEPLRRFKISDPEFFKEFMLEDVESDIMDYWKQVIEDIYKWASGEYVYIGFDEIEFELKEKGYKITGSRYKK